MSPSILLIVGCGAIFLALLVGLASFGVLTKEARDPNRSLAVLEALTAAPDSLRANELDKSFDDRVIKPLMQRSLRLGRRLTPVDGDIRIREKLDKAGNPSGWTPDRVVAFKVVGFLVALVGSQLAVLVFGLSLMPSIGLVVAASMVGFNAPNLYLYQKAYDRTAKLQKTLPDAIDLLTISVESGLGFDAAVAHVSRNTEGPLADEFSRMQQEMQIGSSRSEALRMLADRTDMPDLRTFVSAMVQADAFGIPVGQVLRVQSTEIRTKRRQWAEQQAQKVPVKILIPLIFCILPTLFVAVLGPAALNMMDSFAGM